MQYLKNIYEIDSYRVAEVFISCEKYNVDSFKRMYDENVNYMNNDGQNFS